MLRAIRLKLALASLAALGLMVWLNQLPVFVLASYLAFSLLTFVIYAWDKSAAKRGAWRTPEKSLHLLALAGGWPGALMAQQLLRHKSIKRPFQFWLWLMIITNLIVFAGLFYLELLMIG